MLRLEIAKLSYGGWVVGGMQANTETVVAQLELELLRPCPGVDFPNKR